MDIDHIVNTYSDLYANDAAQWDEPEDFIIALSNVLAHAMSINTINVVDNIYEERLQRGENKLMHMTDHAIACAQKSIYAKVDKWHSEYNEVYADIIGGGIRTGIPREYFYSLMAMINITRMPVKSLKFMEVDAGLESTLSFALRQVSPRECAHTSSVFAQLIALDLCICENTLKNDISLSSLPGIKHVGHFMQSATKLQTLDLSFGGANISRNAVDFFFDNLRAPNLQSLVIQCCWEFPTAPMMIYWTKIASAVKSLKNLTHMALDSVKLDGGTWHDLVEALRDQTSITHLLLMDFSGGLPEKWPSRVSRLDHSLLSRYFGHERPNPFTVEGLKLLGDIS